MIIERKKYLDKLISKKDNGLIKVITGIRRCGKSFLLFELYHKYLNSVGVTDDCIIEIALDEAVNARYKNPFELDKYVREVTSDKNKRFYVFIDEVQLVLEMQNPYVDGIEDKIAIILDPMLATGGSAVAAIDLLKAKGCTDIRLMNIIAAPVGVETVAKAHPDVKVFVACLDRQLNENGYILPGLGDAGDRLFGTK